MQGISSTTRSPSAVARRRTGDADRSAARSVPVRRRRSIVQLLGSIVILAGILVAYSLQASVGAGAVGETRLPSSDHGPTWGSVLEEARILQSMIPTDGSTSVQRAALDRWSPQIVGLADDIALATSSPSTAGLESDVDRLRAHQRELMDLAAGDRLQTVDSVLGSVIEDVTVLASAERSLRIDRIEAASRTAVHRLGVRLLVIATAVVAGAVGVIGLTLSVSELSAVGTRR